jgi:sugar-specific transcriptional regulator TrmB
MDDTLIQITSRQARNVYDSVAKNGAMTAAEIAQELDILPNTIYRAAHHLLKLGVLEKTADYPAKFKVSGSNNAIDWYLLAARKSFETSFMPKRQPKAGTLSNPDITFIKNRTMLLKQTDKDTKAAKHEINFIVSGLEVPDETVLAYRRAATQGVHIRALVQRKKGTNAERLEQWHKLGVEVKHTSDLGIRLFVFDSQVVYLTSYSTKSKDTAFGIRFDYAPMAELMNSLFEERWPFAGEL